MFKESFRRLVPTLLSHIRQQVQDWLAVSVRVEESIIPLGCMTLESFCIIYGKSFGQNRDQSSYVGADCSSFNNSKKRITFITKIIYFKFLKEYFKSKMASKI
jgi:hypothetical protein